ncbi:MAG: hypothetical protein ABIT82_04975, partial [Ramlibacter sp.]
MPIAHTSPSCVVRRRQALALAAGLLAAPWADAQVAPAVQDETWSDGRRQRVLPVRLRWPAASVAVPPGGHPVVLFSHGLGGTR